MKRYLVLLALLVISAASLGLLWYAAEQGLFLFKDSLRDDVQRALDETVWKLGGDLRAALARLEGQATNTLVQQALSQFEFGESLEQAQLALKRAASGLPQCVSLRLVNLTNLIVVDTDDPTLEGKALRGEELELVRGPRREKGGCLLRPDGRLVLVAACRTRPGLLIGHLVATLRQEFLAPRVRALGTPELNHDTLVVKDVLFFNIPRSYRNRERLEKVGEYLLRSMQPYREDGLVIIPARVAPLPGIVAYTGDREQVGLPRLAKLILALNGLIVLGLALLLLLTWLRERQQARLEDLRGRIDGFGDAERATAVTADEIIKETEQLYRDQDQAGRRLQGAREAGPAEAAPAPEDEEEIPTTDSVLSSDHGEWKTRAKDDELQTLIDRVAREEVAGDGAAPGALAAGPVPRTGNPVPVADDEPGIFGARDLDDYWREMRPLLDSSLGTGIVALFGREGDGFALRHVSGAEPGDLSAFTLREDENLYKLFLARRKVLFLKERPLASRTMQRKLPAFAPESLAQLVIVPVLQDTAVNGLLLLLRRPGEKPVDVFALHEVMYLSIL